MAARTLLVAMFRTLGYERLPGGVAQGLASDPVDKVLTFVIVFFILGALPITVRTHVQPGRNDRPERLDGSPDVRARRGYFLAGSSWLHRRQPATKLLALGVVLLARSCSRRSCCSSSR